MQQQWFETWFDSPYYHILYKHRDDTEAQLFMDNLIKYIKPTEDAQILDLACGKGRHSRYLADKDLYVTGVDLSEQSILDARKHEHEQLDFYTHDMRKVFRTNYFDYLINLFTSFGYFESEEENQYVVNAMASNLKENGTLVIDFLNAEKVIQNLVQREIKHIDGIDFVITKEVKNGFINKNINFSDAGKDYSYMESVKALYLKDFEIYFRNAGLKVTSVFGDYQLNSFDANTSDRLIFVCKK